MTKYQAGADALNALNASDGGGGSNAEFTSFKSGTTYFVKVLGTADLISFYAYGIYKQVNSFVAKEPSTKTPNGFPVDNLTAWDKAYLYHKNKSEDFTDTHGQEASKYRAKQRFAMGFYDLDSGEPIIIDVSKNQAQAIHATIKKFENRLGKLAFELSKTGEGTGTTVSLTPVIDMEEDLTDKQRDNFKKAPESFDMTLFDGLLYEIDDDEQVELLTQVGFDVKLIGYDETPSSEITEDDMPFQDCGYKRRELNSIANISEVVGAYSELIAETALIAGGYIVSRPRTTEPFDLKVEHVAGGGEYKVQVKTIHVREDRGNEWVVSGRKGDGLPYTKSEVDYFVGVRVDDGEVPRVFMFENREIGEYWASEVRAVKRWVELPIALDRSLYNEYKESEAI